MFELPINPFDEKDKPMCVKISDKHKTLLRNLGEGNISLGIRILLRSSEPIILKTLKQREKLAAKKKTLNKPKKVKKAEDVICN